MAKMKAAIAAVLVMEKEGVTQAFGVPGAAINPLKIEYEEKMIDELKYLLELGGSYMKYKMSETEKGLNIIIEVSNDHSAKLLTKLNNC